MKKAPTIEYLLRIAAEIVRSYAGHNPEWIDRHGQLQDPLGAHRWLEVYKSIGDEPLNCECARPVTSAPQDGTRVLMWMLGVAEPFVGCWDDERQRWSASMAFHEGDNYGDIVDRVDSSSVYAWMPLPPTPELPMTTSQLRALRKLAKQACAYDVSSADAEWLSRATGIQLQRDNVRGEGPRVYALFDCDDERLRAKAQELLGNVRRPR